MHLPPDLTIAGLDIQTNATPNTNSTATVKAAPGAGRRLRIWYLHISSNSTGGVMVQKFRAIWQDNVAFAFHTMFAAAEAGGGLVSLTDYFPGGYALPANSRLDCVYADSIASLFWRLSVGYTLEDV